MKRGISVLLSTLQFLLLAGCGALVQLDKKSMGVMRYLANKNRVWGQAMWTSWMPIAVGIAMAGLLVWGCVMLASRKSEGARRPWALLAAASLLSLLFVCAAGTASVRAYYVICIAAAAVTLIQAVKCFLEERW